MYHTLTIIDGEQNIVAHAGYDEAAVFAQETAEEGYGCVILQTLTRETPNFSPQSEPVEPFLFWGNSICPP